MNGEPLTTPFPGHHPGGSRGIMLGTTDVDVTIHDRHGCEVVLTPDDALLMAESIVTRYSPDWPARQ